MLLGTQRVNEAGHLEIGGCDTVRLAQEFGTPLYVMDEVLIRANCRGYAAAFEARYPRNSICYASKAFLCAAMCHLVEQEGLNLDVASLGELYTALEAGFPPGRINLHGNNKSLAELEMAVTSGVAHVVLDSFHEIEMLEAVAREAGTSVDVLVRCTPGVDPDTHRAISTGQADTKFGFNISDGSALEAVRRVVRSSGMRLDGIHFHVGSQLLDTHAHEDALVEAVGLMAAIREETGATCDILNIGGGLGVRYRSTHRPPSLGEFAEAVCGRLTSALRLAGLPPPVLQQEPGRAIVGEAGTTLYTVGAIKTVPILDPPGQRTYVAVDGGLSDNPRPQMYGAEYEVVAADRVNEPRDTVVTIAGKHCETDVLVWNARCARLEPGAVLAVQTTGAYNHAMASNYNRFLRPAVVLVADGVADLIVERETLPDLVRRDRVPARLRRGAHPGGLAPATPVGSPPPA
ncbi:MAG: diaminopimelate decarboxylase [Chthonomonadales bacterium]|nr:diaminopimelate decarboxylase [Chthonomonadales bacterium]